MKNTFDFYISERKEKGILTGTSAQTAGLGLWLMIILPGYVYFFGAGEAWIAIGLFLGTYINWHLVAGSFRRYALKSGDVRTFPEYLERRFHDNSGILRALAALISIVLMLFFSVTVIGTGGRIITKATGIDYKYAVIMIAVLMVIYAVAGGFKAVSRAGLLYSIIVMVTVLIIPVIIAFSMKASDIIDNIINSKAEGGASIYLDIFYENGEPLGIISIISQLSWGLGICGLPNVMMKLMSMPDTGELKKGRRTAVIWSLLTIVSVCVLGALGRAYLYPYVLSPDDMDNILILEIINKLWSDGYINLFIVTVMVGGMLASVMAAADSQLLALSASLTGDILKNVIFKKMSDKAELVAARITLAVSIILATGMAVFANNSLIPGLKNIWSCLGCAFGPVMILSLYWKKMNKYGAIAGMTGGILTVMIWDNAEIVNLVSSKVTIYEATQISSIMAGFIISISLIVLVSIFTGCAKPDVRKEFDEVKNRIN